MKQSTVLTPKSFVDLVEPTGNIYETVAIISRRAKQIAFKAKIDLNERLAELEEQEEKTDDLDEVVENKAQTELSRLYEKNPKPGILATDAFLADKIIHHYPADKVAEAV